MSSKGRYGYLAAMRPEGYGDMDVYRVAFGAVDAELSVVKGQISSSDKASPLLGVALLVTDAESGYIIGEYSPNPKTNRFCIIIPPGKYKITASAQNHDDFSEYVNVLGKSSFESAIDKDIVLKKK